MRDHTRQFISFGQKLWSEEGAKCVIGLIRWALVLPRCPPARTWAASRRCPSTRRYFGPGSPLMSGSGAAPNARSTGGAQFPPEHERGRREPGGLLPALAADGGPGPAGGGQGGWPTAWRVSGWTASPTRRSVGAVGLFEPFEVTGESHRHHQREMGITTCGHHAGITTVCVELDIPTTSSSIEPLAQVARGGGDTLKQAHGHPIKPFSVAAMSQHLTTDWLLTLWVQQAKQQSVSFGAISLWATPVNHSGLHSCNNSDHSHASLGPVSWPRSSFARLISWSSPATTVLILALVLSCTEWVAAIFIWGEYYISLFSFSQYLSTADAASHLTLWRGHSSARCSKKAWIARSSLDSLRIAGAAPLSQGT